MLFVNNSKHNNKRLPAQTNPIAYPTRRVLVIDLMLKQIRDLLSWAANKLKQFHHNYDHPYFDHCQKCTKPKHQASI